MGMAETPRDVVLALVGVSSSEPRYTHGHHESVLRSHRWRTVSNSAGYLAPKLRSGMALLDVGSGPGTITAELAEIVAPGKVTALEANPEALELTVKEFERRGIVADYLVGDVHQLDLASHTFDVVHAHQVLQHVADPVQALREMARVTRPGGLVAARDSDYDGFVWFPELPGLDDWRRLYQRVARSNAGEPNAGRRLLHWARLAGLRGVRASTSSWLFATPDERGWWANSWADRVRTSAFAEHALAGGHAQQGDLDAIAAAWLEWAEHPAAWLMIPHGEILATAP